MNQIFDARDTDNINEDWKAKWICNPYAGYNPKECTPAPYFRKSIHLDKTVSNGQVHICGLGYFELYVNGCKASDHVLNPPFTKYDVSSIYCNYNVTGLLERGENVIGVILGNGMYNVVCGNAWSFEAAPWRHHPKLLLQAHLTMENGEEMVVLSDDSWMVTTGPILRDSLYEGEVYDSRLEMPGWNRPGFNDGKWLKASICRGPGGKLKSMEMEPCRITAVIEPIAFWEVRPCVWVYDMGKNITGWIRLKVNGPAGREIKLVYAEKLDSDRDIDLSNINMHVYSEKFQTDTYILKGEGEEVWEPRFTYHGFQYVRMEGFPGSPDQSSIAGCVVHTAFEDRGSFECSNDLLNSIQAACRLSTLGNYHGIPTDCPHREKNGWTGDAALSAEQVLLNFNPANAYRKWLYDIRDCQRPNGQLPGIVPTGGWGYNFGSGPAWDSALVLIPWYIYVYCGDKEILEEFYDSIRKYVEYMNSMSGSYIVDFGLGDWCPPVGGVADYKCPSAVTDTAYFYMDSGILSKMAKILGYEDDAQKYCELAERIHKAFNTKFVSAEIGKVTGDCQTSYACTLYFGLVDGETRSKVIKNLVIEVEKCGRHIDCGILGAKYILHVLTDAGRADLAYDIATQTTFPGWGYWISQGATTLWERWNGDDSRNHHMFSDISAWFYKGLAGINPDPLEPGFKHIIFKPNSVEGLEWVKSSHKSVYGAIECTWKVEDSVFYVNVTVPVNCHATLFIPEGYGRNIKESGQSVPGSPGTCIYEAKEGVMVIKLESGMYEIKAEKM
ncbi:MAG: family 78 glycoside hydrolase catalytic domain [Clostridiales bacterium]|nr:family 78 glycoside hydrolase catalytic domain [Clostridiales bacterium]